MFCLVFTGLNDVVFKRYSTRDRSRGVYVSGIGLVWLVLQLVLGQGCDFELSFSSSTLTFGAVAGLLLTASNLLLLESLIRVDASLGSIIYRLNTVAVVLLSFLFLGEPLGVLKSLGVIAGVVAVFILYQKNERGTGKHDRRLAKGYAFYFFMAILASLFRASYGVVSKAALSEDASFQALILISSVCWIVGGASYAIFVEKRFRITGKKIAYSLTSGVLVFLIVNSLMSAIDRGQASIVIPISNMGFILALVISIALGMERLSSRKVFAVAASVCSVILLSMVF